MSCDETENKIMWATGIELGLLLGLCSFGVNYFRAHEVSWAIVCLVLLSWWLGFSGTILLTADLAEASGSCRLLKPKPPIWLETSWIIVYWTTFVLAWLILPVVHDYCLSGEFTSRARLLSALRLNVRFAIGVLVLAAFFIGYLVVSGSMELQAISGFAIALGNTYGLLFVILLMGNGIIQIPRSLWVSSFPQRELDILFFRAAEADFKLHDAFYELKEAEEEFESPSSGQGVGFAMLGLKKLANIHFRIKKNQERLIGCRQRWNTLVMRVDLVSAVIEGNLRYPHRTDQAHRRASSGIQSCCKIVCQRLLWLWHSKLEHTFMRCCSIVAWILSALLFWSEQYLKVTLMFKWDMSPFGRLLSIVAKMNYPLVTQAVAMVPFLYMNFCCFRTLFNMDFFGNFNLSGPHHSHTGPLLFNGQYLVRLQFALGYNFLTILRHGGNSSRQTAFRGLMSSMEVVPILGAEFNVYTPVIIVVLCALTLWYSRILGLIGFEHEDLLSSKGSAGYERLEEGRRAVEQDRRRSHLKGLWDDEEMHLSNIELPQVHENELDYSGMNEREE